ncbi:hypothetical protein FQB29_003064 [Saccharomyces cerevisiae]
MDDEEQFLKHYNIDRETVIILSKVYFGIDESLRLPLSTLYGTNELTALTFVNQGGLSGKHVLNGVAKSVERLGTDIMLCKFTGPIRTLQWKKK